MLGDVERLAYQFAGGPPHSGTLPRRRPSPSWRIGPNGSIVTPDGPGTPTLPSISRREHVGETPDVVPGGSGQNGAGGEWGNKGIGGDPW